MNLKNKGFKNSKIRKAQTKMLEGNILNNCLGHQVPPSMLDFFRKQAEQKIAIEGWSKQGRNAEVKKENFINCWVTEEAFKQILIKKGIWFRNRGLYFGDSAGAGADFMVKIAGEEVSIGLRSVAAESLHQWKSVAYPDDRFKNEPEKITDYHIVCHHQAGKCQFFGLISRESLLKCLEISPVIYSRKNQENFRVIPLHEFKFGELMEFMKKMEKT